MKRTITLLSLIGCFTLAHAQGGHVFTEGAFRFSVSADVDTATGDSLATIIGFDRDRDGGQAMKEKVLEIPETSPIGAPRTKSTPSGGMPWPSVAAWNK